MNIQTRRWMHSTIHLAVLSVLVSMLTGCLRPYPTTHPVLTPTPLIARPLTPTVPTPAVRPTISPTAILKPTEGLPLLSGPDIGFEDVRFTLPEGVGRTVQAQRMPEFDQLGEVYPSYTKFTLVDFTTKNTRIEPQIQIFPVHELSPSAIQIVQKLKDLLAEQPETLPGLEGMPLLPPIAAGQLLHAQLQYLTFADGAGIRVLTQFGQDAWPINNESLVYIFQGLTSTETYYVSAILPVAASFLPDHVDNPASLPPVDGISFPAFDSSNFGTEYTNYRQAVTDQLNEAPPEEFTPALNLLDQLIQSLQIGSQVASVGAPSSPTSVTSPCVDGLPTRLQVDGFAYVDPDPPLPNNLRSDAGKDNPLMGEIQPGQAMQILDGPKCADGWVWWKVRTFEPELIGWTAEGDKTDYWLIPCESRNRCKP